MPTMQNLDFGNAAILRMMAREKFRSLITSWVNEMMKLALMANGDEADRCSHATPPAFQVFVVSMKVP